MASGGSGAQRLRPLANSESQAAFYGAVNQNHALTSLPSSPIALDPVFCATVQETKGEEGEADATAHGRQMVRGRRPSIFGLTSTARLTLADPILQHERLSDWRDRFGKPSGTLQDTIVISDKKIPPQGGMATRASRTPRPKDQLGG